MVINIKDNTQLSRNGNSSKGHVMRAIMRRSSGFAPSGSGGAIGSL